MEEKNLGLNVEKKQEEVNRHLMDYGMIFIKTRKSDEKIWELVVEMQELADDVGVAIMEVIIDGFASRDIDREDVSRLSARIENGDVSVVILKSLDDITTDEDDLNKFINKSLDYGVILVDFTDGSVICPNKEEDVL